MSGGTKSCDSDNKPEMALRILPPSLQVLKCRYESQVGTLVLAEVPSFPPTRPFRGGWNDQALVQPAFVSVR